MRKWIIFKLHWFNTACFIFWFFNNSFPVCQRVHDDLYVFKISTNQFSLITREKWNYQLFILGIDHTSNLWFMNIIVNLHYLCFIHGFVSALVRGQYERKEKLNYNFAAYYYILKRFGKSWALKLKWKNLAYLWVLFWIPTAIECKCWLH